MRKKIPITQRLTTSTLVSVVSAETGLDSDDVYETVIATFDAIARAAASGHDTAITNFGTFVSYRTKRRFARNPQTGGRMDVPAHQAVKFRATAPLNDAVRRRVRTFTIRKAPKGAKTAPAPTSVKEKVDAQG